MQLELLNQAPVAPRPGQWTPPRELPSLAGVRRVALDTEGTGLHPFRDRVVGVSLAYRQDSGIRSLYAPWAHPSGNMDGETVRRWLLTELRDKEVVFANAKFDLHMLRTSGINLERIGVKAADVAFADALLDDERIGGRRLEDLGQRYCGEGKVTLPFHPSQIARRPSSDIGPYAEQDARLTLMVDEATRPLIRREELEETLRLENALIHAVCHIERVGSRIDVPKLERWRAEARAELERLVSEIWKDTGLWVEPM
jgi:DNA polymerase I-like protein with 3'-5' exonuclease and polymerase domains